MSLGSSDSSNPPAARRSPPRRRPRPWLPYAGGLAVVALIVAGLWPQPAPVETARAALGTLRTTVNEEGKTRIKQRHLIAAPVASQLRRIPFKAGAPVQAGETVLAVLDPVPPVLLDARTRSLAEARRDTAAANLERARASHLFASNEWRRLERLFQQNALSLQERDAAQWRQTAAAKEEAAAESTLRQAEAELAVFATGAGATNSQHGPIQIVAAVSGRVLRVFEESSRVVGPGTPLLEVGDPTDLEVVVDVLSRDGATIQPGAQVELLQWGGAEALAARVRLVEPAAFTKVSALGVEEQRVNVIADLLTPPDQRPSLGDNYRVEARIVVWESGRTLKVPAGALFRRGEQWAAFVVAEGRARVRPVKIGRSSGTEAQVLEGLTEGEVVVLYPGDRVHEGQRVRPVRI